MEFITKKEAYYRKSLRGVGETVTSDEKLDVLYPDLFGKSAVSRQLKKTEPVQENKPQTADITLTRG